MNILFIGLVILGAAATADVNVTPPYADPYGEAIVQALTAAANLPAKQKATAITGVCDYKGTTCPGAKVNLYDGKDLVASVTIDSSGIFKFQNLKTYFHYNVEVDYDRYHVKKMVNHIFPGKEPVHIAMEK